MYAKAAKAPIDPRKVLFIEGMLREVPESFAAVMEYLQTYFDFDVEFVALNKTRISYAEYIQKCEGLIPKLARARTVFLNDASDIVSCVKIRPETKVVQLWHACGACKRWGMDTLGLDYGAKRGKLKPLPLYRNLDLVSVSSPEVVPAYCSAMGLEKDSPIVKPLGASWTDVLFDEEFRAEARRDVEDAFPACRGRKILLYAPTFRGRPVKAQAPDALDYAALKERLGGEYLLLVKHHPLVREHPAIPGNCADFARYATDLPMAKLLCAADVCITDYSSVAFEYALLGKPIAFFAHDLEDFRARCGFYCNYEAEMPGPIAFTTYELADCIQGFKAGFDSAKLAAFRRRFMSACDGHATRRICEAAIEDLDAHRKPPYAIGGARDAASDGEVDISIIVPAYNAADTIGRAVDSVLRQTYPLQRMELIVVDDGSTDATFELLESYERRHPSLIKPLRLKAPSGSPSEPRNFGLQHARGAYVFFLDADDWMGEEAVSRMMRHAREWDSDVLYVKLRGEGGRSVPRSMFRFNEPKVDVYRSKVMWSFGPYKLYRRSLVQDLRFPSYMPEDIGFVLRALVKAERVSVAADYGYYHLTCDSDAGNISAKTWNDVDVNLRAYRDILGFIGQAVPDGERDWALMRRLFTRDVCETLFTIASEEDEPARRHLDEMRYLVGPFYRPGAYRSLPEEKRRLLEAAFGEEAGLNALREAAPGMTSIR